METGRYLDEKIAYGSTKDIFNDKSSGKKKKVLISLISKDSRLDSGAIMIPKQNENRCNANENCRKEYDNKELAVRIE